MKVGVFMKSLLPFDAAHIKDVPNAPGVYIIYLKQTKQPAYVGRSRRDIHDRLQRHVTKIGSRKIKEALLRHTLLEFEYECMMGVEQAESQLITMLGTIKYFNLRRETDPADWI